MGVINIIRRDSNPKTTFRRVLSTIEILGAKQPREVLHWISTSIGIGNLSVNAAWWDVKHVVERAVAALAIDADGEDDDDMTLERALTEIRHVCNYHLNLQ